MTFPGEMAVLKNNKFRQKYVYFLILISVELVICDTCDNTDTKLTKEGIQYCYHNQNKTNKCQTSISGIVIHDADNETGTADVEFDFDPSCKYNLKLIFMRDCNDRSINLYAHSYYTYEGKQSSTDSAWAQCNQKGVIKLKHISTTGCYIIEFNNENSNTILDKKFIVKNRNILFHHLEDHINYPQIQFQYPPGTKVNADLIMYHPYFKLRPSVILTIISPEYTSKFFVKLIPNNTNVIEYNVCDYESNITFVCKVKSETFHCAIKGLDPGNYTIKYSLQDIIQCFVCERCSVWQRCDSLEYAIDTEKNRKPGTLPSVIPPHNADNLLWIIIPVIFCLFIIVTIFIFNFIRRKVVFLKSTNVDVEVGSVQDTESLMQKKKIFLLYPRDTQLVMQVLEDFRKALTEEGFQVYDIFDKDKEREIMVNPTEWINEILDCRSMNIILVSTYCWNYVTSSSVYQEPDWKDEQFLYAKNRVNQDYNNLNTFTVDIGMRMDHYSFPLDSIVSYNLEKNIETFLKILHNKPEYSIDENNDNVWNELKNRLNDLRTTVSSNLYLMDLLHVQLPSNNNNENNINIAAA